MVVNGRLFKVAATTCGLLLTVYALYVYREVTSELQQCGKDLSGKLVGGGREVNWWAGVGVLVVRGGTVAINLKVRSRSNVLNTYAFSHSHASAVQICTKRHH